MALKNPKTFGNVDLLGSPGHPQGRAINFQTFTLGRSFAGLEYRSSATAGEPVANRPAGIRLRLTD